MADRRLLLVLDNAASPRQVVPLLPGAAGVRVVITSRNQLRALVSQYDATAISLLQLEFSEARSLLAAVLGERRLDAEREPTREIVERCAGLPLALRIFAERVSRFPDVPLREFAAELRNERLDALSDFYDADVRAVFSWSYRALDDESARMFRLLSVHPGPDFDVSAAAALAGVSVAQGRRLLERLVADHLVQSRSLGRYYLHDLLRAYSAELCGDDEEAALRLTEWYVHTLENATVFGGAQVTQRIGAVESGIVPQQFSSWTDTLVWRREEWANLSAVMYAAIERGWQRHAYFIPTHLNAYLHVNTAHRHEAVEMFEAVAGFGSPREQGFLQLRLASVYENAGRLDDSLRCYDSAMPLMQAAQEFYAEAAGLINRSKLYKRLGRVDEVVEDLLRALAIAIEFDLPYIQSACHLNLATHHNLHDRPDLGLREAERAVEQAARVGDEYLAARVRGVRGFSLACLGRSAEAIPELEAVIGEMRRVGDHEAEAALLEGLGIALVGLGRRDEGVEVWQRALAICRDLHENELEKRLAARLATQLR